MTHEHFTLFYLLIKAKEENKKGEKINAKF